MIMKRMTDRLRDLVWTLLCEGIDNPALVPNIVYLEGYSKEEIDFCIEWMKNKLGV
jgi:hypothetical protein